jgi:2-polyprenyl-3-methyl-5-hydroxy-6-metoxy-1,4-benzoquinol methylase/uncharacterized protein YbaR (Trm112 family)
MRTELINFLICPQTGEQLDLYTFNEGRTENDAFEGLLINKSGTNIYIIEEGVPVMIPNFLPERFVNKFRIQLNELKNKFTKLSLQTSKDIDWSFSDEWNLHFEDHLNRTWGFSAPERLEQLYLETRTGEEWIQEKLILDAGCGNGQLTSTIASAGAITIGLDFSSSVYKAERENSCKNLYFVRGNLENPPFKKELFDMIISNGVIHHTKNTFKTFTAVSGLVKNSGKFYLWLYKFPNKFLLRMLVGIAEIIRVITSRLPYLAQKIIVNTHAGLFYLIRKIRGKASLQSFEEIRIVSWDDLTPLYRHFHTPQEVAFWFYDCGFSAPTLSHWDNPHGFGMVGTKLRQKKTPGLNFGKEKIYKRYHNE